MRPFASKWASRFTDIRAIVVFRDLPKHRWLKQGFRHVLVAVETGEKTVVVLDPAGGGIHPWAGGCELDEVAQHYRDLDATVVEATANPGGYLYPTPWTCVEVVKRTLGTRGFWILTPHQLYRRLTCEE